MATGRMWKAFGRALNLHNRINTDSKISLNATTNRLILSDRIKLVKCKLGLGFFALVFQILLLVFRLFLKLMTKRPTEMRQRKMDIMDSANLTILAALSIVSYALNRMITFNPEKLITVFDSMKDVVQAHSEFMRQCRLRPVQHFSPIVMYLIGILMDCITFGTLFAYTTYSLFSPAFNFDPLCHFFLTFYTPADTNMVISGFFYVVRWILFFMLASLGFRAICLILCIGVIAILTILQIIGTLTLAIPRKRLIIHSKSNPKSKIIVNADRNRACLFKENIRVFKILEIWLKLYNETLGYENVTNMIVCGTCLMAVCNFLIINYSEVLGFPLVVSPILACLAFIVFFLVLATPATKIYENSKLYIYEMKMYSKLKYERKLARSLRPLGLVVGSMCIVTKRIIPTIIAYVIDGTISLIMIN